MGSEVNPLRDKGEFWRLLAGYGRPSIDGRKNTLNAEEVNQVDQALAEAIPGEFSTIEDAKGTSLWRLLVAHANISDETEVVITIQEANLVRLYIAKDMRWKSLSKKGGHPIVYPRYEVVKSYERTENKKGVMNKSQAARDLAKRGMRISRQQLHEVITSECSGYTTVYGISEAKEGARESEYDDSLEREYWRRRGKLREEEED